MSARTVGVVGTLVWDRIVGRREEPTPVEEWGGIGYALAALAASLPHDWSIRPIVKLGADMQTEGRDFLSEIPRLDLSALVVVPEANNRVELRYESASRRCERLTGGVPAWSWPELAPRVAGCDALYVNFISGFEMPLETARALCDGFGGPTYADLHSLFLGKDAHGHRVPRTLEAWAGWLRCFHAVQMNEDELALLGGPDDPWARAAGALGPSLRLITVTLGDRGAAYSAVAGFDPRPLRWPAQTSGELARRAIRGTVTVGIVPRIGDPTGCGDVWGAATFARLLAGDPLEVAMAHANRRAGLNVEHRGARGLAAHLGADQARRAAAGASGGAGA